MLDFYYIPDGQPAAEDPNPLLHAGSLTLEDYRSMDRVAESQGQDMPIEYFTDQSLSLFEVEQAHRSIVGLGRHGKNRGDGNSAFEPLLEILGRAAARHSGLQTVSD